MSARRGEGPVDQKNREKRLCERVEGSQFFSGGAGSTIIREAGGLMGDAIREMIKCRSDQNCEGVPR